MAKQPQLFDDGAPIGMKRGPWPEDAIIRSVGFRIHARPQAGYDDAIWARDGHAYHHDEALGVAITEKESKRRRDAAQRRGEI